MGHRQGHKDMRFSIIVGTYNQAQYMPKLIESLDNQTFKDFEVLFCDDGSDDGTIEVIESLPVSFEYRIFTQPQKGMRLAKSVNQGIKAARGEHCVFIMGDSFPELNYLELLDEWCGDDNIVCGIRVHVEDKKIIEMDYRLRKGIIPKEPVLLPVKPWELMTGNGLAIPTEAMRLYGGWDEDISGYGGEDQEIIGRLYYKGYLCWSVPQLLLYHHYHYNKASSEKNREIAGTKLHGYAQ